MAFLQKPGGGTAWQNSCRSKPEGGVETTTTVNQHSMWRRSTGKSLDRRSPDHQTTTSATVCRKARIKHLHLPDRRRDVRETIINKLQLCRTSALNTSWRGAPIKLVSVLKRSRLLCWLDAAAGIFFVDYCAVAGSAGRQRPRGGHGHHPCSAIFRAGAEQADDDPQTVRKNYNRCAGHVGACCSGDNIPGG